MYQQSFEERVAGCSVSQLEKLHKFIQGEISADKLESNVSVGSTCFVALSALFKNNYYPKDESVKCGSLCGTVMQVSAGHIVIRFDPLPVTVFLSLKEASESVRRTPFSKEVCSIQMSREEMFAMSADERELMVYKFSHSHRCCVGNHSDGSDNTTHDSNATDPMANTFSDATAHSQASKKVRFVDIPAISRGATMNKKLNSTHGNSTLELSSAPHYVFSSALSEEAKSYVDSASDWSSPESDSQQQVVTAVSQEQPTSSSAAASGAVQSTVELSMPTKMEL